MWAKRSSFFPELSAVPPFINWFPLRPARSIDNLRNGLETQAKVYATSVIRFTLELCNFTLNTFQDFVFTYFRQEQKCECNYRLLKLFREINEAENHHLMFP